jgi:hypothetical protein
MVEWYYSRGSAVNCREPRMQVEKGWSTRPVSCGEPRMQVEKRGSTRQVVAQAVRIVRHTDRSAAKEIIQNGLPIRSRLWLRRFVAPERVVVNLL